GGVRVYSINSAGVTRNAQQSLSKVDKPISAPGSRKIFRTVLYSTSEMRDKWVMLIFFCLAISSKRKRIANFSLSLALLLSLFIQLCSLVLSGKAGWSVALCHSKGEVGVYSIKS